MVEALGFPGKEIKMGVVKVEPVVFKMTKFKLLVLLNVIALLAVALVVGSVGLAFKNPQVLAAIFKEIEISSPIANDAFMQEMQNMELRLVGKREKGNEATIQRLLFLEELHYDAFISDINLQYDKLKNDIDDVKEITLIRAVKNFIYLPDNLKTPDLIIKYEAVLSALKEYGSIE